MLEIYPKKVKLVFKHFPLRNHSYALKAAIAAEAAGRQDKFWQMHDKIFADFKNLSDEKIDNFALELKLNITKFSKDLKNPELAKKVQKDFKEGVAADVRGTPTLFINGKLVKDKSIKGMKREIEKLL